MDQIFEIDHFEFYQIVHNLIHIGIAFVLAFPIGWEREIRSHSAGLRTFPLVAIGACGFMMLGREVFDGQNEASARVAYGIITGIGFIGGGAIIKDTGSAHGTATAASIWNTGAIGVAVAWGRYEIAIILSVLNYLTLRCFTPLKKKLHVNDHTHSQEQKDSDTQDCDKRS